MKIEHEGRTNRKMQAWLKAKDDIYQSLDTIFIPILGPLIIIGTIVDSVKNIRRAGNFESFESNVCQSKHQVDGGGSGDTSGIGYGGGDGPGGGSSEGIGWGGGDGAGGGIESSGGYGGGDGW